MESQSVAAKSRLAQMQMRFQQKQQQHREQARAEMTTVTSVTSETTLTSKGVGNGRVRQMFDERRRGAGIDRSYPLKPIDGTAKQAKSMGVLKPTATGTTTRKPTMVAPPKRPSGNAETSQRMLTNGNTAHNERNRNYGGLDNYAKQTIIGDRNNNKSSGSNHSDTVSNLKPTSGIKLKPVVTKKSPSLSGNRVPPARQSATPVSSAGKKPVPKVTTPEKSPATVTKFKAPAKTPFTKMSSANAMSHLQTNKTTSRLSSVPAEGLAECKYCSRTFNIDRLTKHEAVCQKISATKRKIFDASKHRVQGTEAEKFVNKQSINSGSFLRVSSAAMSSQSQQPKKSDWRKKHQEFIMAIRSAKQVQAHLAKGGKLSDLPPPPPSENPDYIQCPTCLRRFNQTAAERHIPKCATMQHNKPRPSVSVKKR